ncbi:hypothetical protein SAMN02745912_02457 [Paramaledivibacter caminithermalis DSM 15212]|uniref:Uncharacterized protein n=1 Tax=Paramaledivibacter caminithermalis (strain DSM 15212 / CIP 107654 / DViRD3) TaxID=1121301 RepID=A0A1M6Q7K7_PARC5|nr:hypothetical protein SAMN02745912_02457 [Paramaledivibacter caminithermalis DSM 15212]
MFKKMFRMRNVECLNVYKKVLRVFKIIETDSISNIQHTTL